jgi:hypothetical protein
VAFPLMLPPGLSSSADTLKPSPHNAAMKMIKNIAILLTGFICLTFILYLQGCRKEGQPGHHYYILNPKPWIALLKMP